MTKNMGDFNSARFDVFCSVPFDATESGAAEAAFDKAKEFCEKKLVVTKKKIEGILGGK
jgi:hypothetical protein